MAQKGLKPGTKVRITTPHEYKGQNLTIENLYVESSFGAAYDCVELSDLGINIYISLHDQIELADLDILKEIGD